MELSIGEVSVRSPGLRGWKTLLKSIPTDKQGVDNILDVALSIRERFDASGLKPGDAIPVELNKFVADRMLPFLPSLPDVIVAVAQACLRDEKGNRISQEKAWDLTEEDVVVVFQALMTAPFLRDFMEKLGNSLSGERLEQVVPA